MKTSVAGIMFAVDGEGVTLTKEQVWAAALAAAREAVNLPSGQEWAIGDYDSDEDETSWWAECLAHYKPLCQAEIAHGADDRRATQRVYFYDDVEIHTAAGGLRSFSFSWGDTLDVCEECSDVINRVLYHADIQICPLSDLEDHERYPATGPAD